VSGWRPPAAPEGFAGGQYREPPATLQAGMPELRSTHIIF
jgi:hypothetical protein